jgi:hypothetical protein
MESLPIGSQKSRQNLPHRQKAGVRFTRCK